MIGKIPLNGSPEDLADTLNPHKCDTAWVTTSL